MKITDLMSMALKNLTSRKLRTFLTILGVIIGSISIIVMVSFGHGITESNKDFIASMGNIREIIIYSKEDPNNKGLQNDEIMYYGGIGSSENLTTSHEAELEKYPHVEAVVGTVMLSEYQIVVNNRYEGWVRVTGINPDHIQYLDVEMADGTGLVHNGKNLIVFGPYAANDFYDDRGRPLKNVDLSNAKIELKRNSFEYGPDGEPMNSNADVQKMKYAGTIGDTQNWDLRYSAFVDIKFARDLLIQDAKKNKDNNQMGGQNKKVDPRTKYDNLKVIVDEADNVEAVKTELEADGYKVSALTDMLESFEEQTKIIKWIFGGIGAVSLLVAAIGISNTMVMSIQERTREIGVMKVIGASLQDIKRLFLVEASMIGLLGGIIGVIISYMISFGINHFATKFLASQTGDPTETIKISIIPVFLAIMALVFSALIGLVSGYFPARRAMKLSALDAIRAD